MHVTSFKVTLCRRARLKPSNDTTPAYEVGQSMSKLSGRSQPPQKHNCCFDFPPSPDSLCSWYLVPQACVLSFGLRRGTAQAQASKRKLSIDMTTSLPSPDLSLSDTASQPDEQPATVPKTSAACQQTSDMKFGLPDDVEGSQAGLSDYGEHDKTRKGAIDPRAKISSLLKDKEKEWTAVVENRKGPLRLLDLPMDVLKEIVKEVSTLS